MSDTKILKFQFESPSIKKKDEYGIHIAKWIDNTVSSGHNSYYYKRNKRIEINRQIAQGRQSMGSFLDRMGIDGQQSFINLDWKPPAIMPKFIQVLLNGFIKRDEKPKVSAIDPVSIERKKYDFNLSKGLMNNSDVVSALGEQGVDITEGKKVFDDEDELNLFFGLEYKLPEEILFEKGIQNILYENGYDVLKRRLLMDIIESGLVATKTYLDGNNKIIIRRVKPENLIYGYSEYDDFRDASFFGEILYMKVVDLRLMFPEKSEREFFELAKKYGTQSDNFNGGLKWDDLYSSSQFRPYDDWKIEVIDFEFKTIDVIQYSIKTNRFGNKIVDIKGNTIEPAENKEVANKNAKVIYEGLYIRKSTDGLLRWRVSENMIRPQEDVADVYFRYSVHLFDNQDMFNMAIPERCETSVNQMVLAHLKIQQLIAKMRPSGLMIDIDGVNEIDLGLGKDLKPLEIQKIYDQTGTLYIRRTGDSGDDNKMPAQELANTGNVPQIQQLINTYNFYLQQLRDNIGMNEISEGSSVNPRMGVGLAQSQLAISNNATDFNYGAFINIIEQTAKKSAILLWDSVVYGGKAYRDYLQEDKPDGIEDRFFNVKIEMLPSEAEKQYMDNMAQTALSAGIISFEEAFKVKRIQNIKLAEMYLSRYQKKRESMVQENAQKNSEMNAQVQQQSIQMTAEVDAQMLQMKSQSDAQIKQMEIEGKQQLILQEFIQTLILESFKSGKPIPPQYQKQVDIFLYASSGEAANKEQEALMMEQAQKEQSEASASKLGGNETPEDMYGIIADEAEQQGASEEDITQLVSQLSEREEGGEPPTEEPQPEQQAEENEMSDEMLYGISDEDL